MEPITNVRFRSVAGHAIAVIDYGGAEAILSLEQKEPLVLKSLVSLHPKEVWGERLPPIEVEADPEGGIDGPLTLKGYAHDPRLVILLHELAAAVNSHTLKQDPRWDGEW